MPTCPKISQFCGKIAEVPSQIQNSRVGSAISKYINFPLNLVNRLTTPLSQKLVSLGIRIGGERYERHCQNLALNHANGAIEAMNEMSDLPAIVFIDAETGAEQTKGCRGKLSGFGDGIYSLSNRIHSKGEDLEASSWMAVRGAGKAVKLMSYPVAAGSYVPSAMGKVGQKVPEAPWAKMDVNDPRRLIAENIYAPLIANIDRAVMEKEVRLGANTLAAGAAYAGLSTACSYAQNYLQSGVKAEQDAVHVPNAASTWMHRALAANGFAWVAGPVLSKGKDLLTNDNQAQIAQLKDAIIAKNPQLSATLQKMDGMDEENAKDVLDFVVTHVLERHATRLNFLGSDQKTIDALSKFPAV